MTRLIKINRRRDENKPSGRQESERWQLISQEIFSSRFSSKHSNCGCWDWDCRGENDTCTGILLSPVIRESHYIHLKTLLILLVNHKSFKKSLRLLLKGDIFTRVSFWKHSMKHSCVIYWSHEHDGMQSDRFIIRFSGSAHKVTCLSWE